MTQKMSRPIVREIKKKVLQSVKDRNIRQTIKRRMDNWIVDIFGWNCLLQHVIEGKIKERI